MPMPGGTPGSLTPTEPFQFGADVASQVGAPAAPALPLDQNVGAPLPKTAPPSGMPAGVNPLMAIAPRGNFRQNNNQFMSDARSQKLQRANGLGPAMPPKPTAPAATGMPAAHGMPSSGATIKSGGAYSFGTDIASQIKVRRRQSSEHRDPRSMGKALAEACH